MFPIRAEKLSLLDIARYWSREIRPTATKQELADRLAQAWWLGELEGVAGTRRVQLLRILYMQCQDKIAFSIPGIADPPQFEETGDDGLREIRPVLVPLPSGNPEDWAKENCGTAFQAIADGWRDMPEQVLSLVAPPVAGVELDRTEFMAWLRTRGYTRPRFWGSGQRTRSASAAVALKFVPQSKMPALVDRFEAETGEFPRQVRVQAWAESQKLRLNRAWLRDEIRRRGGARGRPKKAAKNRR